MNEPQHYQMRGMQVLQIPAEVIHEGAKRFCQEFSIRKRAKTKRYDVVFELLAQYSITLNVVNDDEWRLMTLGLTEGHCDPHDLTISIPESIYFEACAGDRYALSVVFHEIGHLLLMHKQLLHYSIDKPTQEVDSEWQADTFADCVLKELGVVVEQLMLNLKM